MLVVLLQINSPCKLFVVRVVDMIVLGDLHECCFMLYASADGCMNLIYVGIVYFVFRVLDGRIRPIELELRALGA